MSFCRSAVCFDVLRCDLLCCGVLRCVVFCCVMLRHVVQNTHCVRLAEIMSKAVKESKIVVCGPV